MEKEVKDALTKQKLLGPAKAFRAKARAFRKQTDVYEETADTLPKGKIKELDLFNREIDLATFILELRKASAANMKEYSKLLQRRT